ncbi:MAG: hypothetical protein ACKVII_24465 [Planctomycetales bacterium]|jgi:hypothetical protein
MPTRPKKRQKSSQKNSMSPPSVLEICRQPKSLIIGGCLALATVITIVAFQSGSDSVADSDPTEQQLDDALGALGMSNSANPSSGSVNPDFNFDDDAEPELQNFASESSFLNRSTASTSTPDFEPSFDDDAPRFGRPIIINDPRSAPAIQQADFRQPDNAPSQVVGARVTANQAVWLTGSIETR